MSISKGDSLPDEDWSNPVPIPLTLRPEMTVQDVMTLVDRMGLAGIRYDAISKRFTGIRWDESYRQSIFHKRQAE